MFISLPTQIPTPGEQENLCLSCSLLHAKPGTVADTQEALNTYLLAKD